MQRLNEYAELYHIKVYVEDEHASVITCIKNSKFPNTSVVEYIWEGCNKVVYWEDYHNLPSRGMIYDGETFINGENGETFRKHLPAYDFTFNTFVFIKDNIVLGYYLVTDNFPSNEIMAAALKSNPRFEIVEDLDV